MKRPAIEPFKGKDGKWYWRLRHANGRVLATSESYSRKHRAWEVAARVALHGKFRMVM